MQIIHVEQLDESDLPRPKGRPKGSVAEIRDVHHTVARLYARGVKPPEIGAMLNRTGATIRNWLNNPAMGELVSQYNEEREIELVSEVDYNVNIKRQLRTISDELLLERLIRDPESFTISHLIKISADNSDRTGIPKQENKVNLNVDLGTRLDKAVERSRAAKEVAPNVVKLVRRV